MSDERIDGTLLQGADGTMYFIPDEMLKAFAVTGASADSAASVFETRWLASRSTVPSTTAVCGR